MSPKFAASYFENPPITDKGIRESIELNKFLLNTGITFDYAFCSPMLRTIMTSTISTKNVNITNPITIIPYINEIPKKIPGTVFTPDQSDVPLKPEDLPFNIFETIKWLNANKKNLIFMDYVITSKLIFLYEKINKLFSKESTKLTKKLTTHMIEFKKKFIFCYGKILTAFNMRLQKNNIHKIKFDPLIGECLYKTDFMDSLIGIRDNDIDKFSPDNRNEILYSIELILSAIEIYNAPYNPIFDYKFYQLFVRRYDTTPPPNIEGFITILNNDFIRENPNQEINILVFTHGGFIRKEVIPEKNLLDIKNTEIYKLTYEQRENTDHTLSIIKTSNGEKVYSPDVDIDIFNEYFKQISDNDELLNPCVELNSTLNPTSSIIRSTTDKITGTISDVSEIGKSGLQSLNRTGGKNKKYKIIKVINKN